VAFAANAFSFELEPSSTALAVGHFGKKECDPMEQNYQQPANKAPDKNENSAQSVNKTN